MTGSSADGRTAAAARARQGAQPLHRTVLRPPPGLTRAACVLAAAIMTGEPGDDDASHWHWHLFYSNAADERILVPKRSPWMGWTFNFAHTESWVATGGLLAFAAACVASKKR